MCAFSFKLPKHHHEIFQRINSSITIIENIQVYLEFALGAEKLSRECQQIRQRCSTKNHSRVVLQSMVKNHTVLISLTVAYEMSHSMFGSCRANTTTTRRKAKRVRTAGRTDVHCRSYRSPRFFTHTPTLETRARVCVCRPLSNSERK